MSNTYFQFKQFMVRQEDAAMKVGTDGCLLGAWAPVPDGIGAHVLDIGTGTGVIALMLAQRLQGTDALIDAIDVEPNAVRQAGENVRISPWAEQIRVKLCDLADFHAGYPYRLIVSNPPYFIDSLKSPDKGRTLARHSSSLPFSLLFRKVFELLDLDGTFCVVLPADLSQEAIQTAVENRLYVKEKCWVYTVERKAPKRILLSFVKQIQQPAEHRIVMQAGEEYTPEFRQLLKEFYLKF